MIEQTISSHLVILGLLLAIINARSATPDHQMIGLKYEALQAGG
jgi:hypothetical protein